MGRIDLVRSLEIHSQAVEQVIARAESLPESRWREALAEGKWSAAEVLAHLVSTYDTVTGELRGGAGMEIRTRIWQRWLLRLTVVPAILSGRPFPKGARAPRETRPGAVLDRGESVALFRNRASEFEEAARSAGPNGKLTHAYFGSSSVADGVLLCARHVQHHALQLPDATASKGGEK